MSDLTDDEYTCLMIMAEGQNLIAMKDTRWFSSIASLAEKGFARGIGNANYVITTAGQKACADREKQTDLALTSIAEKTIHLQNARLTVQQFNRAAVDALVNAAKAAAVVTGDSPSHALRQCIAEVSMVAQKELTKATQKAIG